jgi:hypothetical protein
MGDSAMNLRLRVLSCACGGEHHWYADIDDAHDRQPDDPFWYTDLCRTQAEALEVGCAQLSELDAAVRRGERLLRVLESA